MDQKTPQLDKALLVAAFKNVQERTGNYDLVRSFSPPNWLSVSVERKDDSGLDLVQFEFNEQDLLQSMQVVGIGRKEDRAKQQAADQRESLQFINHLSEVLRRVSKPYAIVADRESARMIANSVVPSNLLVIIDPKAKSWSVYTKEELHRHLDAQMFMSDR